MPKITKHGGASNKLEDVPSPLKDVDITPNERDVLLTLGDEEIELKVRKLEIPVGAGIGIEDEEGEESSVGNNSSQSSKPTQTIDELLGKDVL